MPIPTVEFYEAFIDAKLTRSFNKIKTNLSLVLNIPRTEIEHHGSFIALSKHTEIPEELVHHEIIGVIAFLMAEYNSYIMDTPSRADARFWKRPRHPQDHVLFAYEVTSLCDRSHLCPELGLFKQNYIEPIKAYLSALVLDMHTHPEDPFSNLVHALINKTAGIKGWGFHDAVVQKLGISPDQQMPYLAQTSFK
jgi:hypothetical protein